MCWFNLDYPIEMTHMHHSDTSSIAQYLKKYSCPTNEFWKILTKNTILEQQNNKQKLQIFHIRNKHPKLNRINFKFSANVLKCL